MSNRTLITDVIIEQLKKIDGRLSSFDNLYTFNTDLHENVYLGDKFIDEINDFPSIYVTSGTEYRTYHTAGLTEAEVITILRAYTYNEEATEITNLLIQDIEHVIYNMKIPVNLQAQDVTIKRIIIDSGLLAPYGMAEIFLSTRFEIFNN